VVPRIDGSTVLVTGANGGLGVQFVEQALALGARRVYASARNPRAWDDERIVPLRLDVTDEHSVAEAATAASDTTILVNNAAVAFRPDNILDVPMTEIRRAFETNFFGALAVARAFAPVVIANGGGAFVNVHSVLSWIVGDPKGPTDGHQAYAATKAAFWSATNSMRLNLLDEGVHVLGLHLAYTATAMTAGIEAEMNDPADVVRIAYSGLARGDYEVTVDALSTSVKQALAQPLTEMYPRLPASA
jgi:NAD(P)-dependent dehydrogenase (short-subunit alcohol dehydrogenase family)